MALFRAQILLDETQHEELEKLSRACGRSMSDLVREIVADYLARTSEEESVRRSVTAVDRLADLRQRIEQKHGGLPASFLDHLREERDAEVTAPEESVLQW